MWLANILPDILMILRWLTLAVFIIVEILLLPMMIRAFTKNAILLDPLWALIWMLILNRLLYQITGVIATASHLDSAELAWRIFMQFWSLLLAGGVLWIKHWFEGTEDDG